MTLVHGRILSAVTPKVDTEDLIDANEVAELLGLAHRNAVSLYQRRYPNMPRPVIVRSNGRTLLWQRSAITRWALSAKGAPDGDS